MMLSQWHQDRADRNAKINPFTPKEKRVQACGNDMEFPSDKTSIFMIRNAEKMFEPKKIIDNGDWLVSQREGHQMFDHYKRGLGNIKWINPRNNKVYLMLIDDTFKDTDVAKYKKYAQAFFPGAVIDILKKPTFLEDEEIEHREGWQAHQYRACGSSGILVKMKKYKPADCYATLAMTNNDLYPGPKWNFCYGWASYTEGVGTFSFCRYDPAFDGIDDPNRD